VANFLFTFPFYYLIMNLAVQIEHDCFVRLSEDDAFLDRLVRRANALLSHLHVASHVPPFCQDLEVVDIDLGSVVPSLCQNRLQYRRDDAVGEAAAYLTVTLQGTIAWSSASESSSSSSSSQEGTIDNLDFVTGLVSSMVQAVHVPFSVVLTLSPFAILWDVREDRLLLQDASTRDGIVQVAASIAGTPADWLTRRLARHLDAKLATVWADGLPLPPDWPERLADLLYELSHQSEAQSYLERRKAQRRPPSLAQTVQRSIKSVRFTRL
jgi:hypothetical protein